MAAETPTGPVESRALSSARAAPPPFAGRAAALARPASDRHVDRWAPEHGAVRRSRSLGALSFVDRLLQPWMTQAAPLARPVLGGTTLERAQSVSWVFPRPWYQDELAWMAAAREAEEGGWRGAQLTTRGTFATPSGGVGVALPAGGDARQAVVAVAETIRSGPRGPIPAASLEYVAPSMTSSASPAAPGAMAAATSARALRAWTPQVSFAAAQAAEVMAATVAATEHAGLSSAQRSPLLEGLAFVAPADVAGEPEVAQARATAAAPARAPEAPAAQLARAVAQLAAAQAVSRAAASTPEAARAAITETAPPLTRAAAPSPGPAAIASPAEVAYRAEQARVLDLVQQAPAAATSAPSAPSSAFAELVETAGSSPAAAHAMRAVELFARAALAGTVAPASGPRVAMPAGLGGALVGHDAAVATRRPMVAAAPAAAAAPERAVEPARAAPVRTFAPVWAVPPTTAALAAVAAERPAAVSHLAWADRWLARMSGASTASLAALDVAAEHRAPAPRTLTIGAPEVVYVLPDLADPAREIARASARPGPAPLRAVPDVGPAAPSPSPSRDALRIADDEATPDEVFAAIARAARPGARREPPAGAPRADRPAAPALREVPPQIAPAAPPVAKATLADAIAGRAPTAPAAGLHAGLASSPMAAALAGILPLQTAPVFDPRALFADGLTRAFLAGVMTPDAAGASFALPSFVARPAPSADAVDSPQGLAARAPDVTYVSLERRTEDAPADLPASSPLAAPAPLLRVRSPLLDVTRSPGVWRTTFDAATEAEAAEPAAAEAAEAPAAALASPLTHVDAPAWSPRPGMTAGLAQGFAVERERTAADLAFDFVAPEQVLAARVFGFGPIEAAQAARLAVAGPSGLSAMAAALDLTFLRQLHVAAEESAAAPGIQVGGEAGVRAAGGAPARAPSPIAAAAPAMTPVAPITAWPAAAGPASGTVFGVERRAPRGAFLWPAGVVAALDLRAELPEGAAASNVAALELLAAGAVAHMGSFAMPGLVGPEERAAASVDEAAAAPARRPGLAAASPEMTLTAPQDAAGAEPSSAEAAEVAAAAEVPAAERTRFESIYLSLARSAAGRSLSPSVRAARALAIAAAQDGATGQGGSAAERARLAWSVMPAVYAGGAEPGTGPTGADAAARGRALPELTVVSPYGEAPAGAQADDEMRPGLSRLAARAGEAIGSFVHPSASEVSRASSGAARVAGGSADRGPAGEPFVHELIRTGRSFTRVGGGETEIPAWFESAAKKMLEQRGLGESLSVAELTLIASTPARQVAASTRDAGGGPAPTMSQAPAGEGGAAQGDKPDIDKIAADVYAEILRLIDVARERSGDPWL